MELTTNKEKLRDALRKVRKQYRDSIAQSIIAEPNKTYTQIAREHGVSEQFVFEVAKQRGLGRRTLPAASVSVEEIRRTAKWDDPIVAGWLADLGITRPGANDGE